MARSLQIGTGWLSVSLILGLPLCPLLSHAQHTTLQICVIQNPGDSCTGTGGGGSSTGSGSSSGGGGGGGAAITPPVAFNPSSGEVYFSGIAYPSSMVTLLRDGAVLAKTTAGPDARFQFDISNVTPGTYTYGVWSQDSRGVRSITNSFSVAVTPGVGTVISGIYLPPTIDVDKSQVKRGDPLTILGASAPGASVSILVRSDREIVKTALSDKSGVWKHVIDTLELDMGSHDAMARWKDTGGISPLSAAVSFEVGDTTITKERTPPKSAGDISGDGRVNISDFSVMAYWYKRPFASAGAKADLNHDGKIDLKDFSILAYYWTG